MTTTPLEDARERVARIIEPSDWECHDRWLIGIPTEAAAVVRPSLAKADAILSALAEKEGKSGSIPESPSWTPLSGAIGGNDLLWVNPAPHAAQAGPTGTWRTFTTAEFENARADALAAADLPCAPNAHPESGVWQSMDTAPRGAYPIIASDGNVRQWVRFLRVSSFDKDLPSGKREGWWSSEIGDFFDAVLWTPVPALQRKADGDAVPGAEGDRRDVINPIDPSQTGGLTELRALSEKATAGPWVHGLDEGDLGFCEEAGGAYVGSCDGSDFNAMQDAKNAAFIVAAVNHVRLALQCKADGDAVPRPSGSEGMDPFNADGMTDADWLCACSAWLDFPDMHSRIADHLRDIADNLAPLENSNG